MTGIDRWGGPIRAISGGGTKAARGNPAAGPAQALLPVLSGRGTVAALSSTLYSTTEAIATAVKDALKEPDGVPAEGDEGRTVHGGQ